MFTLSQALEAIKDKPEFSAKDKGGYTVIDYNFNTNTTFVGTTPEETKILLNLRGTAFDNTSGEIIRLPFNKFFNLGEDPETDNDIDFSYNHVITQKLDGSMLAPIFYKNNIMWGTRAGVTEVSELVPTWLSKNPEKKKNYDGFLEFCQFQMLTPIFEFCSKENQVVIEYKETNLVLLAVRSMTTGAYKPYTDLMSYSRMYDVPLVKTWTPTSPKEFNDLVNMVSKLENDEGIVIRMESGSMTGHMIKIKADEYVRRHKAVDGLRFEKDFILLALNNELDDVLPILDEGLRTKVQNHKVSLLSAIKATANEIFVTYTEFNSIELQKDFALAIKDNKYKHFLFKLRSGKESDLMILLFDFAKKMCHNQASTKELKEFLNFNEVY